MRSRRYGERSDGFVRSGIDDDEPHFSVRLRTPTPPVKASKSEPAPPARQ
jgi:hypothetical protein